MIDYQDSYDDEEIYKNKFCDNVRFPNDNIEEGELNSKVVTYNINKLKKEV